MGGKRALRPCRECGGPKEKGPGARAQICSSCRAKRDWIPPKPSQVHRSTGQWVRRRIGAVELEGLVTAQANDMKHHLRSYPQRFKSDDGRRIRVQQNHEWAIAVAERSSADPWADPTFDAVCVLMGVSDASD